MIVRIAISGVCGRMGLNVARLALPQYNNPPLEIVGALETPHHPELGQDLGELADPDKNRLGVKVTDDINQALQNADVLIEFTTPQATMAHLDVVVKHKKAMVIGTTGLSDNDREYIERQAEIVPIVLSPNMSVGVNVMLELVRLATQRFGPSYDVNMAEAHHIAKKDSPSGTAKRLLETIADVRAQWKITKEIPCKVTREGDIVGEHTVVFSNKHESLEVTHKAFDRQVFAMGALKAATFVVGRPPRLYDMSHVLQASR